MPNYIVVFEVPATATVTINVTADNQQLGLIDAFDALRSKVGKDAEVSYLALDQATNISLDLALSKNVSKSDSVISGNQQILNSDDGNSADAPGPIEPFNFSGDFRVYVSETVDVNIEGSPHFSGSFIDAECIAKAVMEPLSRYASAALVDMHGKIALKTQSVRGGWEVQVGDGGAQANVPEGSTWIASFNLAKAELLMLAAKHPDETLAIYDFTNRIEGPTLFLKVSND
ncbi:MAG: hypothetical protein Q7S87_09020 [Agitococcus sp.]|nr:hypothetical protein [Agitococcus sp.]